MMPKKKEPTETATKETKTTASKTSKTAATAATTKTTGSTASKSAKPASKVEKPTAASSAPTAKATKPAAKAPAKAAKPVDTAAKPATKENPITTVIVAKFDVGHGNNLYIRGDGHSLSWESGTLMENAGGDTWQWTTTEAREGVLGFKLLINDQIWSVGENMNAPFGETTTFYPAF